MGRKQRAARMIAVGSVLKKVRLRAGLSQEELAEQIGRTSAWIARVEAGSQPIDVLELRAVAYATGRTLPGIVRMIENAIRPHERRD